jgi:hypothetical protein
MIKNPHTNRMMKIGSAQHLKAVALGYMTPDTLGKSNKEEPAPKVEIPPDFTTEKGVAEICTDIIVSKKKDFKGLSQSDTDELIRELLYKKLYGNKSKSKIKVSKNKSKKYYSSDSDDSA